MLQAQTPKDTKNQNQKSKTVEKPDTKNSKLQNLDPKSQTPNPKPQTFFALVHCTGMLPMCLRLNAPSIAATALEHIVRLGI
jgi:hypothetical protein